MSYPKVPPKPNVKQQTKLTEERKARLLKLQEREELKGLLISKFKKKYGGAQFIDKEVENFIKTENLTEANLRRLDDKLAKRQEMQPGSQSGSKAGSVKSMSNQSVHSQKSQASQKSAARAPSERSAPRDPSEDDARSVASSQSYQSSVYVPEDDEDEWAAILEHNTIMYREEERQRLLREQENRVKMRKELDRQMQERGQRKRQEVEENLLYEEAQVKNIELMAAREQQKEQEMKNKINQEKRMRDKQLSEEMKQKRDEDRRVKEMESRTVKRLHEELDNERRSQEDKRREEREYMLKMYHENEDNKRKMLEIQEEEKQRDQKAQEDYARMLDRQEEDRLNEIKAREERQQQLMARMADTVLKEQNLKSKEEDMILMQQIDEREQLDRMEDERRMQRMREQQMQTRAFLEQQMVEKEAKRKQDKESHAEQATMWKRETEEYGVLEKDRNGRQKNINKAHQEVLRQQMLEKKVKKARPNMNPEELAINKRLLKNMRDGKKGVSTVNMEFNPDT